MENSLGNALLLMLVGMITVFVVLLIVVNSGKFLIYVVNRMSQAQKHEEAPIPKTIDPHHMVIISTVIGEISNGQASSIQIEKL